VPPHPPARGDVVGLQMPPPPRHESHVLPQFRSQHTPSQHCPETHLSDVAPHEVPLPHFELTVIWKWPAWFTPVGSACFTEFPHACSVKEVHTEPGAWSEKSYVTLSAIFAGAGVKVISLLKLD